MPEAPRKETSPTSCPKADRKEWDFWAVINVGMAASWAKGRPPGGSHRAEPGPTHGQPIADLSPSQEKSLAQVSEGRDSYTSLSFSFCHGEGQDSRSLRFF